MAYYVRFFNTSMSNAHLKPLLNFNGVDIEGGNYFSSDRFTTNDVYKVYCEDGYSFNPNNPVTPILNNVSGICGVWLRGLGTQDGMFNTYEFSDDYKTLTFTLNETTANNLNWTDYESGYCVFYPVEYSDYIQATEEAQIVTYTITQNLTGCSTDITATTINEGESLTGTFTLDTGYENLSYSVVMGDTTITGTNNTFTIDSVTNNVIITATATKKVLNITNTLTKCEITSGSIPNSVEYGDTIIFTVKPITGYKSIVSAYYLSNGEKTDIHINSSGYVSTAITIYDNIDIYISAVATYTVTETLTNIVSADSNVKQVEENESFLLQYTPETDYLIDTLTSNIGTVTISSDKTYATISGTATENITVTGTGKKIYTVSITGNIENATCNYSDGETVNIDKPLKITANSGYEFLSSYNYKQGVVTYSLTKSDDNTILTCAFKDGYNYTFNDNYVATKQIEKIGTFCNLYKVTNDELTALSKKRFVTSDSETMDYGQFITQLYILPLDIPSDYLGDKSSIILGNYDSTVESTLFNKYSVEIDCGTITVPEKYNNVYDYLNTTCTLRLPFFNPIILDTDNVINKTITIKFIIDLYSGNVTVNIYSTFTDSIIESQTTNIVTQIPFIQKQNNSIVNQLSNVYKNLIDTAQIEVVRNIPYYTDSIYGKETIDFDYLNTVTGYCEVNDIDLTTTATNEEKTEIQTLLKQGVFINGI